jgi:FKBP-type peptidyl-prolyl cis-trans isomerase FkpA
MKKSIKAVLFLAIITVASLTSCSKYPGYSKTKDGLYYKFYFKSSDTTKVSPGKILTLNIRYYFKYKGKDSVLLDNVKQGFNFIIPCQIPVYKGDIYSAFAMMHKGDSASFILKAANFFMKTAQQPLPPFLDSTSMLYFDIKLLKSQTQMQMEQERQTRLKTFREKEPILLQNYLKKNNLSIQPNDSGLYFIEKSKGTGKKVEKGDMVKYQMVITSITEKGENELFSSYKQGREMTVEYGQPGDTKAFQQAFNLINVGGKGRIIAPSKMAFGENGITDQRSGKEIIAPYAPIVYDVEILSAQSKDEYNKEQKVIQEKMKQEAAVNKAAEPKLIETYLRVKKIAAKPTASGLYYIEKVKGNGAAATKGKTVTVNYTGKLLNGKVFDSSTGRGPFKFTLGSGQVIRGWDEGISLMKQGGKATLIIPSKIAYGEQAMGQIPANSPLVFDVELVKVDK